jgi:tetratricopeptide (TPR) repeat protein
MKSQKLIKNVIVIFLMLLTATSFAQTKNDAIAAYNEGVKLLTTDPAGALAEFERCIEVCTSLGEEGEETKALAEIQIPKLHYSLARESMKAKNYVAAIEKFNKAIETADMYNDEKVKSSSLKLIPQLHYILANSYSKGQDFENAHANYDKAIEYDPNYTKAILGKGLVYRTQGDVENMKVTLDKVIEIGLNTNDPKSVETAEKVLQNTYFNAAVRALSEQKTEEAEEALKLTIDYGNESVEAYYQLGKIFNTKKQFNEAVAKINKALELETGGEEAKAKLYYELATSYVGLGDTTAACDAYKNASFGAYAENAKYQIEHVLKCK